MTERYSGISSVNHWITALLVIAMLTLGLVAGQAPTEETEHFIMGVHIGLGFFTFLFVAWRIGYRLSQGWPEPIGDNAVQRTLARCTQKLILLALALLVLSGPLYLFTEGEGMEVFGWFTVYIPLGALSVIHEPMESIHVVLGTYVLPILLVLHVLGAIKYLLGREAQDTPADL